MSIAIDFLNNILWSYVLIAALLGIGLYFTFKLKFIQFRYIGEMIRVLFDKSTVTDGKRSISSFKSFCIGAATRIGTGNLAGVAVAIGLGGPGAIFWMWLVALLGGATSFVESTLAQVYKVKDKYSYRGGPAYYLQKGLNMRWLGIIFAVLIAVTFGLIFNSVQSNTISFAFENAFGINRFVVGIVLSVLTAAIIFGGVQRIANFSATVVPLMAAVFVILSLVVVLTNLSALPAVFKLIIGSAFGFEEAFGGAIGAAIMNGVKRGLFSNEAGMGSAPNAAATATVSHPAKQGFIQTLGVFFDTIIICTATAFIILLSDVYQSGNVEGIQLLQNSLDTHIGGWASIFIAVSIFLFAFSSIIGSYYYGETNLEFIKKNYLSLFIFRLATIGMVMFGSLASLGLVWSLADLFMALMTLINLFAVAMLSKVAIKVLKDYQSQRKLGKEPTFDPQKLGIDNAECWEEEDAEKKKEMVV
ncbi:alanine/glycine:cation symporter family protein [Pseudalkalibacillus caeni]|uniref:Alanine:cation symporter family protein n=1 Tax=Exobacillus caeni TaxID=2574798 RepID=A0A5R9EXY5_9BACL|nr:alanine/glycine:cation symporter family protein [Pseudalkalibacillus caeni]TLS35349.1 alanine:cation symporter family protein [Pseudalkalibacillus caeni]